MTMPKLKYLTLVSLKVLMFVLLATIISHTMILSATLIKSVKILASGASPEFKEVDQSTAVVITADTESMIQELLHKPSV